MKLKLELQVSAEEADRVAPLIAAFQRLADSLPAASPTKHSENSCDTNSGGMHSPHTSVFGEDLFTNLKVSRYSPDASRSPAARSTSSKSDSPRLYHSAPGWGRLNYHYDDSTPGTSPALSRDRSRSASPTAFSPQTKVRDFRWSPRGSPRGSPRDSPGASPGASPAISPAVSSPAASSSSLKFSPVAKFRGGPPAVALSPSRSASPPASPLASPLASPPASPPAAPSSSLKTSGVAKWWLQPAKSPGEILKTAGQNNDEPQLAQQLAQQLRERNFSQAEICSVAMTMMSTPEHEPIVPVLAAYGPHLLKAFTQEYVARAVREFTTPAARDCPRSSFVAYSQGLLELIKQGSVNRQAGIRTARRLLGDPDHWTAAITLLCVYVQHMGSQSVLGEEEAMLRDRLKPLASSKEYEYDIKFLEHVMGWNLSSLEQSPHC